MKERDLSVEEILSSIRGVINNHSVKFAKKPDVTEDILELTEERIVGHADRASEPHKTPDAPSQARYDARSEALRDFADRASNIDSKSTNGNGNKSIEEFVLDILRPEISKWLKSNLPELVKQLVEKEIKRLAS